jgi:YHS domain-containing protein
LEKIGANLDDPVRPELPARISNDSLLRLNHETYFFAAASTKQAFERTPWRWCGRVTDPVTLERFAPAKASPASTYEGRRFFFASDSSRTVFAEDPALYADPPNRMAPADSAAAQEAPPAPGPAGGE